MTDIAVPQPALSSAPATAAVCPYLRGTDGAWRSSTASGDHRCHAVAPAAVLATDKQRRLCLVDQHVGCSTYLAALAAFEEAGSVLERPLHRPVTRTAPLVLDRGRMALAIPGLPDRGVAQGGLVALMAVAFGALAVTRLGGTELTPAAAEPGGRPPGSVSASSSPEATPTAAPATPAAPSRTLVPSGVEPTTAPTSVPTEPTPDPSPVPTSYKVKSGDTLSGIASVYGTTWQALAELNGLSDPRRLRVGQVLELPPADP